MPVKTGDFMMLLSDIFISLCIKWENPLNLKTEGLWASLSPYPNDFFSQKQRSRVRETNNFWLDAETGMQ